MNPRQRRGVLFMMASGLLTLIVFIGVTGYTNDVRRQVGDKITIYRASKSVPPYQALGDDVLEAVEVPEQWAAPTAIRRRDELAGRKVPFQLEPGTVVTTDMLVPVSELSPTEREIAIQVNAVTGVAGRVQPGSFVDIYAVFDDVPGLAPQVRILVKNVRVVSVAGTQSTRVQEASGLSTQQDVVPVTLALEPNDALSVTYANAFAKEVRLVSLPTNNSLRRDDEPDQFDATKLGGQAVPENAK